MNSPKSTPKNVHEILENFNGQALIEETHSHLDQILFNLHGARQSLERVTGYVHHERLTSNPYPPQG